MFGLLNVKAKGQVSETALRRAVRGMLDRMAPHLPALPGFGSPGPFLSLALSKVSDADLSAMVSHARRELAALADVQDSAE